MADSMQNPRRLPILGCVFKPEAGEGGISKQIIWSFFILVDELSLSTKYQAKRGGSKNSGQSFVSINSRLIILFDVTRAHRLKKNCH